MTNSSDASSKKVAAGVLGIVLGGLGIHKFILGYNTEGIITLVISFLTCGIGFIVFEIIGLVEGIIYLTKTDEEFKQIYIDNRKAWF
ncbi:TM2 domain-containing protein [Euhalothece natronophila Z-M001]|uniref:TM2 domain-containing protein n=1 Tax=Euhalothece natronophila Z-M001 TaxID=522448 RepID=A0A5B8NP07_9CHRO|nr:TM2 domain-containing protein [Euhalothece natronophila]QDZ40798.1 TM2 domain-containing protein [Euhalothece natronophila Z-M001]